MVFPVDQRTIPARASRADAPPPMSAMECRCLMLIIGIAARQGMTTSLADDPRQSSPRSQGNPPLGRSMLDEPYSGFAFRDYNGRRSRHQQRASTFHAH
jgi:hypothetical protein